MSPVSMRWTLIRRAARGIPESQAVFARHYGPVIRAFLRARWRGSPLFDQVDDAAQQVFLDCLRPNGALGRIDPGRGSGIRAFLHGVVTNVARTFERQRARERERQSSNGVDLRRVASGSDSAARALDREWARALLRDAADLQLARAHERGPRAVRRHRLMELRHVEGQPIRMISARWNVDPAVLHREYKTAREEFRGALMDLVRELRGGGRRAVATECVRLLEHFS